MCLVFMAKKHDDNQFLGSTALGFNLVSRSAQAAVIADSQIKNLSWDGDSDAVRSHGTANKPAVTLKTNPN
jgi:16S rRNA G966 N2-methylase RsmD